MSRTIGIIGLPNVGKSTIFNILTNGNALCSNYPFSTIEPNIGAVSVPDERLTGLNQLVKPKEVSPAHIKFMDLAGLIKGSSRGEGLGNRFLAHARECDALLHVVRCFEDSVITYIEDSLSPERDIDIINAELCLADLEMVEKRLDKISRLAKSGDKAASEEMSELEYIRDALKKGEMPEAKNIALPLLTIKPVIYLANMGDKDLGKSLELSEKVSRKVAACAVIKVAGRLEMELKDLPADEEKEFRKEWGEEESPLKKLIEACYGVLNLITFYTIARDKLSAWLLKNGETVLQGAAKIHTDMERGFIKAEVIDFKEFMDIGSCASAKEKGAIKIVGKEYTVHDGDIVYIHFKKLSEK